MTAGRLSARARASTSPTRGPNLPALTEKDIADLALAAECGADFVALSFVRSRRRRRRPARPAARGTARRARTIAKIEKIEAYEHLDEILEVADGIMVARGDYGVEAGVARVPLMQKDTIYRATQLGKLVITATQMLESMIHAPEPTRAEAADVANAVIDGTSAVMLSAETGVGEYPVEAVRAMAEIAHGRRGDAGDPRPRARRATRDAPPQTVLHAAVAARRASSTPRALVIPTATGGGARACAKYRPDRADRRARPRRSGVANQLTLEWGVQPCCRWPSPRRSTSSSRPRSIAPRDVARRSRRREPSSSPRAGAPAPRARRA